MYLLVIPRNRAAASSLDLVWLAYSRLEEIHHLVCFRAKVAFSETFDAIDLAPNRIHINQLRVTRRVDEADDEADVVAVRQDHRRAGSRHQEIVSRGLEQFVNPVNLVKARRRHRNSQPFEYRPRLTRTNCRLWSLPPDELILRPAPNFLFAILVSVA